MSTIVTKSNIIIQKNNDTGMEQQKVTEEKNRNFKNVLYTGD